MEKGGRIPVIPVIPPNIHVQDQPELPSRTAPTPPAAPSPGKPYPLPPGASADAHELWEILSLYRGAEVASRLAQKLGWNEARVIVAAQELSNVGRARISGDCIAPIHSPTPGAGQRDSAESRKSRGAST